MTFTSKSLSAAASTEAAAWRARGRVSLARFVILFIVLGPEAAESVDRSARTHSKAPLARHEGRVDARGGVEISEVPAEAPSVADLRLPEQWQQQEQRRKKRQQEQLHSQIGLQAVAASSLELSLPSLQESLAGDGPSKAKHDSPDRHLLAGLSRIWRSGNETLQAMKRASQVADQAVSNATAMAENVNRSSADTVLRDIGRADFGTFIHIACAVLICFPCLALVGHIANLLRNRGTESADGDAAATADASPDQDGKGIDDDQSSEQLELCDADALHSDLYGLMISRAVRDIAQMVQSREGMAQRLSRMAVSFLCLGFSILLQVYLLEEMRRLVAGAVVHNLRMVYDHYEYIMYGSNYSRMHKTLHGFHRGHDVDWDRRNFDQLTRSEKLQVCSIPLSQPTFFMTVLLVWTFTVVADLRCSVNLGFRLGVVTPTCKTMRDALEQVEGGDEHMLRIVGLTAPVKAVLLMLLLLPRLAVDCLLLWLGCRWLCATSSFQDVLINAVALEFVLGINALLFRAVVPYKDQAETERTYVLPASEKSAATLWYMFITHLWGIIGVGWVLAYVIFFQRVLPDYKWDVQSVCATFLKEVSSEGPDDYASWSSR